MTRLSLIAIVSILLAQSGCSDPSRGGQTPSTEPKITITPTDSDTGTFHYAAQVEIEFVGKKPLIIESNVERGEFAPVALNSIESNASHRVFIGLTSTGGGMQSWHAYAVNTSGDIIEVDDHMIYTVSRDYPGIVVNRARNRIGFVIPTNTPRQEEDWQLTRQGVNFDIIQIMALEKNETERSEIDTVFFSDDISGKPHVHWYGIGDKGTFVDAR